MLVSRLFLSCTRLLSASALLVPLALTAAPVRGADWPMFNADPGRSGVGSGDTSLSPANVGRLHRRWVATFDEVADSTPILLTHVRMPGGSSANLLFQTTKHGTTYAINAETGALLWHVATRPPTMYPQSPNNVESKITTSTRVADPSGRYIYAPGRDGYVHKLHAATGAEVRGGGFPLQITRMPDVEKTASALNLANGYLYAATSGYIGDQGAYDGHVVVLRLRDGVTHIFNSLCSTIHSLLLDTQYDPHSTATCPAHQSGIWSRSGVVVDPDPAMGGRIYVTTGNGSFDAARGGSNYGDSVLSLSADGARLLGYYTPATAASLNYTDADLGSTAPALLPRESGSRTPLMAVQGGKDGILRLLNRARLGGVHAELQVISASALHFAPAVWQERGVGTWVYVGDGNAVTAYRLHTDPSGTSRLVRTWAGGPGTSPIIVNGVLFAAAGSVLNALDARTGRPLWTSQAGTAGGQISGIHWESPIAVNGHVYISDESGHLTAYGL